ncbi:transient receptor potential cation channel protein painless [Drosophila willistoni]|uniref:transient receptor potential cation channel protein painless n=1 Tax=Drosophila willistoni TaxID=7260 RepID=UPI001F076568|nr:transient receptor potential cation channel protein painless [Drosophila willistoni]
MSDPEETLKYSLTLNNFQRFETALRNGARAQKYDENGICIYEMCLQRPNSREFIEACLRNGCTADYVNEGLQKAAINYAADSACSANILALLNCNTNLQLDHEYAGLTPLNALAKRLTNDNVNDLDIAIFELLCRGASPNIPDKNDITPLHYIVMKSDLDDIKKKRLINRFLKEKTLDLDRFRNGQLRQLLREQYPNLILPEPHSKNRTWDITYDQLFNALRYGNENNFIAMSAHYNGDDNDILNLLKECITRGRLQSFDELLRARNNLNINKGFAGDKKLTLIELSLIHGNWHTLEKLLNHQELKWPSDKLMLINLMGRLDELPVNEYCDYWKCFHLLVQSKHVDINETDESGHTPLHYAAQYRHADAVHSLLAKGAHLGAINEFKEMPLADIDAVWLEMYFNQCITTRSKSRADRSFEIIMDFKNLDLSAIDYMAETKHLRSLLKHPLITSFILFKWSLYCGFFYFHLIMHTIFTVSFFIHAYFRFSEPQNESIWTLWVIYICLVYLTFCEIVTLCIRLSQKRCFTFGIWLWRCILYSLLNIVLIVLSYISIHISNVENQRTCTAYAIFITILCFSHLLGALPYQNSISTHILMLRETSKNYIKILLFYSIYFIESEIEKDLAAIYDADRLERKSLVLWRRPLITIMYSFVEACELILIFTVKLLNKWFIAIAFVGCLIFFVPGPHEVYMAICKRNLGFILYWLGLGVVSSAGFGTGVHSFLLYLGPHIASVALAAYECRTLELPSPPYPEEKICPDEPYAKLSNICMLAILGKVWPEALLWGIGTALGEMPPYFMARPQRAPGEYMDGIEKLEWRAQHRLNGNLNVLDRAKLHMGHAVQRSGFLGILLFASIPNPLYDLIGLTCGHFLIPFWKFFIATLIGKAFIKATIQQIVVIVAFSDDLVSRLIHGLGQVPMVGPHIQAPIRQLLRSTKQRMHNNGQHDNNTSSLDFIAGVFQICALLMIAYFIISTVNCLAQRHYRRLKETQRKLQTVSMVIEEIEHNSTTQESSSHQEITNTDENDKTRAEILNEN